MDPKVKKFLSSNHKASSTFASAASNLLAVIAEFSGDPESVKGPDMREMVVEILASAVTSVRPDYTCWPFVKDTMTYIQYLNDREAKGTLTPFDLVRPNLLERHFLVVDKTTGEAIVDFRQQFNHYERVQNHRIETEMACGNEEKRCAKCNTWKPKKSFRSGAVCNSCRARAYRNNVSKRSLDAGADERSLLIEKAQSRTNKAWEETTMNTDEE